MMKRFIVGLITLLMSTTAVMPVWASGGQFDFSLRRGENRRPLPSAMFMNPIVRKAYTVAKKIPWVLDSIYCYCFCEESPVFRHKSLLSCYVETHASQ